MEIKEDLDESRMSGAGGQDGLDGVLELATEENNVTGADQVVEAINQNEDSETMGNIGPNPP